MLAASVSPAERPVSCLPLKVISVLCTRTLNFRSRSFWVSKSISNLATSLNFGWAERLARMGAWALQIGHQGAVTSTRIDLPAACAASNAAASNGFLANAQAGTVARVVDAASAVNTWRRVSMWSFSFCMLPGLYRIFPADRDQNQTVPDQMS